MILRFLPIFLFLLLACGYPLAAQPKNELPLYGDKPKTKAEVDRDEKFIREVTAWAGSREKAYDQIMKRGWEAVGQGDFPGATRRFNQAYLLNAKDYRAYWGLGVLAGMGSRTEDALKLFEKAYQFNKSDPRFLCDYGFALVNHALSRASTPEGRAKIPALLTAGQEKYMEAMKADPKNALPYSRLAVLDFYRGDFKAAWNNVAKSEKLGGEGLDARFLTDLEKAAPRPKP